MKLKTGVVQEMTLHYTYFEDEDRKIQVAEVADTPKLSV